MRSQDSGAVSSKSVYLAQGINLQGEKELSGLWIAKNERAKFWLSVMTELKNYGLQDIFIACCDGLKGFPKTTEAVYPQTQLHLCLVYQVRHSPRYVGRQIWRSEMGEGLRAGYRTAKGQTHQQKLEDGTLLSLNDEYKRRLKSSPVYR